VPWCDGAVAGFAVFVWGVLVEWCNDVAVWCDVFVWYGSVGKRKREIQEISDK